MIDDFMLLLAVLWLYTVKCLVDSWTINQKVFGRNSRGLIKVIYQYLTRLPEEFTKYRSLIGDNRSEIEPDISRAQVCESCYVPIWIYKFRYVRVYVRIYSFISHIILHKIIYTVWAYLNKYTYLKYFSLWENIFEHDC
jgi:hypothetical protein